MAYPTLADSDTTKSTGAGTSAVVDLPSTVDAGDLLVIVIATDGDNTFSWTNFTEIDEGDDGKDIALACAYKIADGSEDGGTETVTLGSNERWAAVCYRITAGTHDTGQAPECSTPEPGDSGAANATTCTPAGGSKDYLWITCVGLDDESLSGATQPSGYSDFEYQDSGTPGGCSVGVAYRTNTAASEDAGPWSHTAGEWMALTIAIHPTGTTDRRARVSAFELEVPNAARRAQVSAFELETPDAARRAQVSAFELETPNAARRAQISAFEFETPDAARRAQVSAFELETPDEPRRAQVSAFEFETPDYNRRAQISAFEFETPDEPTANRRAQVSAFELETPDAARRAQVSAFELETPDAARKAQVSAFEFEVPDSDRRAQVSAFELETPDAARRAQTSAFELEVPDAARRAQVSAFEFEVPIFNRRAQVSAFEFVVPDLIVSLGGTLHSLRLRRRGR